MNMEMLIRQRLLNTSKLTDMLPVFETADANNIPAIFYQKAPEDVQWQGREQYPKIVFTIDKFDNAERGTMGVLTVELICSETGASPEEVEPVIRETLEGVFFTPTEGETFSAKWRETSLIEEAVGDRQILINGALMTFDVYEYPNIKTSDPDPIAALNLYALKWNKQMVVIGESELPSFFSPTRDKPAIYFSRRNIKGGLQDNSAVWLEGVIMVHIFAPTLKDRLEWLAEFHHHILLDGEVTLLDGSPMFIKKTDHDYAADEIRGQLRLDVSYGVLRKPKYSHTMMESNMSKPSNKAPKPWRQFEQRRL